MRSIFKALVALALASFSITAHAQAIDTGARGLAIKANSRVPSVNVRADFKAPNNSTADSTPAYAAAMASNGGSPGVVVTPAGPNQRANLSVVQNGLTMVGPGWGLSVGKNPPTTSSLVPFDPTKAAITVGDGATQYSGNVIRDFTANCADTNGERGIDILNGSYLNYFEHVRAVGCRKSGIRFLGNAAGGPTQAAAKNGLVDWHSAAYYPGAIALDLADGAATGTMFNNDHQLVSGSITTSNGAVAIHMDSSTAQIAGLKVDTGGEGALFIEKNSATENPILYCAACSFDSGSSDDTIGVLKNFPDPSVAANGVYFSPLLLNGSSIIDGTVLAVTNTTTLSASVASGATVLPLSSLTGSDVLKRVLVRSATGGTGTTYSATILSIDTSNSRITVDKPAPAALVSGASVDIGWDEEGAKGHGNTAGSLQAAGLQLRDTKTKSYLLPGFSPYIFRAGNKGTAAPFNTNDLIAWLGTTSFHNMYEFRARVATTSVARVGATITVTTSAVHSIAIGDTIAIYGANEAGINGTYEVKTVPTNTSFTVTSSITNADLTATGTPVISASRDACICQGTFQTNGAPYRMKTEYGTTDILARGGGVGKDLLISPPGGKAGSGGIRLGYGETLQGTVNEVIYTESGTTFAHNGFGVTGAGGFRIGTTLNPFQAPSFLLSDAATNPSASLDLGTSVLLWSVGGTLNYGTGLKRAALLGNLAPIIIQGTIPAAACTVSGGSAASGTTITAGSNNAAGEVVIGSSATSCTVTFATANAYANAPFCTFSPQTGGQSISYSVTSTAITFTSSSAMSGKANYTCIGHT